MAESDTALTDTRFAVRCCPFCGESRPQILFDLAAAQFCSANWSYSKDYAELLGISAEAAFPVDRCESCGFIYARFLPDPEFLTTVYDRVIVYEKCLEGSENRSSHARRLAYVATLIGLAPAAEPQRALDYGCGLGVSLRILQAASVEAVGYDPSPVRNERVGSFGVLVEDEQQIEDHGPFEMIVCDNVLEHLAEPAKTLDLLASVCSPEAVIYVSVPSYEARMVEKQLAALNARRAPDMTLNPWEHLNYFTLRHLDRMMQRAGFAPIEASQLPGAVDIGLRPEPRTMARLKNCLGSAARLTRYGVQGRTDRRVEHAFYRFTG